MGHRLISRLLLCFVALCLRAATSLFPYSGEGTPPLYGDFEAQRHWMEISRNLPAREWYYHSEKNNLTYWGLDYPPLSGYVSYFAGGLLERVDPKSTSLLHSQGYETSQTRVAMRITVLLADCIFLIPAVLACSSALTEDWIQTSFHASFEGHGLFILCSSR